VSGGAEEDGDGTLTCDALLGGRVPSGPVNDVSDIVADPHRFLGKG